MSIASFNIRAFLFLNYGQEKVFFSKKNKKIYKPHFIIFIMAEKGSGKKLLAILVVLVAVSLVIDLISLNTLYSISKSGNLGGELATESPYYSSSSYSSSPIYTSSYKEDACYSTCSGSCTSFWSNWMSACKSNCNSLYPSAATNSTQAAKLKTCKRLCNNAGQFNCRAACEDKIGSPYSEYCCYSDYTVDYGTGSFSCIDFSYQDTKPFPTA